MNATTTAQTATRTIGQPYVMIPLNWPGNSRQWQAKTPEARTAWIAANPDLEDDEI